MSYTLNISEAAENDLRNAFLWYEDQSPGLGDKFQKQIDDAVKYIQKNPLKVQIKYSDVRIRFLKKFPFGIHFSIEHKLITVLAVFHTSENPDKWNNRI